MLESENENEKYTFEDAPAHTSWREFLPPTLITPTITTTTHAAISNEFMVTTTALERTKERHMKIMLIRAIGNPLPPQDCPKQTFNNLKFTLENEPEFPHLTKWWVLNRLVNETDSKRLESLLTLHRQSFFIIPFNLTDYAKLKYRFDYIPLSKSELESDTTLRAAQRHDKALYITNANDARNAMIEFAQAYSPTVDWILPWDTNCYLHPNAYRQLYQGLQTLPSTHKYAVTMMNQILENRQALLPEYQPIAKKEPQIIFHRTALGRFHPQLNDGRMAKIEFLRRLKSKGSWDNSPQPLTWQIQHLDPFFQPLPDLHNTTTDGLIQKVGYVTHLSAGPKAVEPSASSRQKYNHDEALNLLIWQLDTRVAVELFGFRPGQLVFYNQDALERDRLLFQGGDSNLKRIVDELHHLATQAVTFGPWSVTDKPDDSVAVSGDKHDYFHVAPYFWPSSPEQAKDPNHKWHNRDGQRYPSTTLHGPGSENYDRTRLQEMQHNTTILGLAYYMTGETDFAQAAARNIRTWFLNKETRMNPHLKYAQVQNGHANNTGTPGGIIEFKDIYFMLDAIRIIEKDGFLSDSEQKELRAWFAEYLDWLETSSSGKKISNFGNNQGVYYGIQVIAVASFIQDTAKMIWHAERSTAFLFEQIEEDGSMPRELNRPICEHYQFFALQGWSILSRMAATANRSMWTVQADVRDVNGELQLTPLCRAAKYAIPFFGRTAKCRKSIDAEENGVRWWPLLQETKYNCPLLRDKDVQWPIPWFEKDAPKPPRSPYEMPMLFHPHDAIAPFWNLGLVQGDLILPTDGLTNS
jgi:hypothetical protein